ncbi:hypothetical protein [Rubritalea tangerina]|uniref:hypothetical protein n=1 Tax=Rubritalea tangerina TaxID=430798 RepID=UPI00360CDEF5
MIFASTTVLRVLVSARFLQSDQGGSVSTHKHASYIDFSRTRRCTQPLTAVELRSPFPTLNP